MSTVMRMYADEAAAMHAVDQLMAAGVSSADIQLVKPEEVATDHKRVGTFDDDDADSERVGTFDDEDAREVHEGSFDDTDVHDHNAGAVPRGSFADIDGLPKVVTGDIHSFATKAGLAGGQIDQAMQTAGPNDIALIVQTQTITNDRAEQILGL